MAWAALTGPTPNRLVRPGAMSSTMASSWARLSRSCCQAWPSAKREAADLAIADGLLPARTGAQFTPGQCGQSPLNQGGSGHPAVSVVRGQQQSMQPPDLRGPGHRNLVSGDQQDAQGIPVTIGARHRQLAGVQAQRGQHRQVGIDRIGLALPAALPAAGLLTLEHYQACGGQAGAGDLGQVR